MFWWSPYLVRGSHLTKKQGLYVSPVHMKSESCGGRSKGKCTEKFIYWINANVFLHETCISNAQSFSQKSVNKDHVISLVLTQTFSHGLLGSLWGFPNLANENESELHHCYIILWRSSCSLEFPCNPFIISHLIYCFLQLNCTHLLYFGIYTSRN